MIHCSRLINVKGIVYFECLLRLRMNFEYFVMNMAKVFRYWSFGQYSRTVNHEIEIRGLVIWHWFWIPIFKLLLQSIFYLLEGKQRISLGELITLYFTYFKHTFIILLVHNHPMFIPLYAYFTSFWVLGSFAWALHIYCILWVVYR